MLLAVSARAIVTGTDTDPARAVKSMDQRNARRNITEILTDFTRAPETGFAHAKRGLTRFSLLQMAESLTQLLTLVGLDLLKFSFSSARHGAYLYVGC